MATRTTWSTINPRRGRRSSPRWPRASALLPPPPRRLPRWLMRLVAPYVASVAVHTSMRVSNARAKSDLAWQPRFKTYREGSRPWSSNMVTYDVSEVTSRKDVL
jgi:hypothetical protein